MGINLSKNEEQLTNEIMNKISLEKDKVNLEKHVVNFSKTVINLSKEADVDMSNMLAKVVVVLDYSWSMETLYKTNVVQKALNRLVPLGLTFDDNGEIDVYLFQNSYRRMPAMAIDNYEDYVKHIINNADYNMGGTDYAPVLNAIINGGMHKVVETKHGFFGIKKKIINEVSDKGIVDDSCPTFILFITDGENGDKPETNEIIQESSEKNVFIQFIGIGDEDFQYLKSLDNMKGRKRDNTGFSQMESLQNVSDNELYRNILEQFSKWLKGLQ